MKGASRKDLLLVSILLFSMLFGAGNLIFPPFLGQSAGAHVWLGLLGFILSDVGLSILAVAAVAKTDGLSALCRRVHPSFALLFPLLVYVSIGPALAIPRAGSLAFEMGVRPFLPSSVNLSTSLFFYTLIFFLLVFWLSLNPSKLVDRLSKLLTPALLVLIFTIFIKSWFTPMESPTPPIDTYASHPILQGFTEGYMTMDALAALVYGLVISSTLRERGATSPRSLRRGMMVTGLGAGALLTILYVILGWLGSRSGSLGAAENGAQVLANLMQHLFGTSGTLLLGLVFTLASFCVCIGLVTSCAQYFASTFPRVSYPRWALLLSVVSLLVANLGLTQILKVSVPILSAIYPVVIVLILLAVAERWVPANSPVYPVTAVLVGLYSVTDVISPSLLEKTLLHSLGIGWIVPAMIGIVLGVALQSWQTKKRAETV